MKIVSKEQLNELDALIEKYSKPEFFEETVLGRNFIIRRDIDVFPLKKEREKIITMEECKNIVETASAFFNLCQNARWLKGGIVGLPRYISF